MRLGATRRNRSVEWVVGAQSPRQLGAVLALLGDLSRGALEEGRVLVDGVRERDAGRPLVIGQRVVVHAPRENDIGIEIIAQSGGFVFVSKPPDLPTEPERPGGASARSLLAEELGIADSRVQAVSRLEVGVSGVVAFARTAEARRRSVALRDHGELSQSYVGISAGAPSRERDAIGSWRTPIDGRPAETRWRVVAHPREAELPSGMLWRPSLLALSPVTAHKHQIRSHAAAAKVPLLGDRQNGGPERVVRADGGVVDVPRVALHAVRVVLPRPGREALVVTAPAPDDLRVLWRELGGDEDAWQRAGANGP